MSKKNQHNDDGLPWQQYSKLIISSKFDEFIQFQFIQVKKMMMGHHGNDIWKTHRLIDMKFIET